MKVFIPLMIALATLVLPGCTNPESTPTDSVIDITIIPGVTAPVRGASPVTMITETAQYTGSVTWNGSPANFAASTVYTATITLTAKAGYTFTGVTADSFTVEGASSVTNSADSGTVTAVFPATEAIPDTLIDISAIPGLTIPSNGSTPVTAITETSQFTGTVSWTPAVSGTFAADTVYTATITLTAKAGYTFNGVTADSFTVEGASSVTNSADSGTVTAVFPATDNSRTSANIGILRYVPAGSFQRDDTAQNISIITQPYWMSQNEITREQFLAIMGTDPSDRFESSGMSDPVQQANWYHAITFCNKLSLAEGLTPVYSVTESGTPVDWATLTYGDIPTAYNADWLAATAAWGNNGYRLPTEMEWMWAAMGAPAEGQDGGTDTTGYAKAFAGSTGSNDIDDYAWYGSNSSSKSHPAGTKTANELGLYDMSGNVWEWCWDKYSDTGSPSGTLSDYRGADSSWDRIMRGGSNNGPVDYCTMTYQKHDNADYRYIDFGFRVVRP